MSIKNKITIFLENERSGGIILIASTLLSLLIANSAMGDRYISFWNVPIGGMSLEKWINDGLMAVFFLYVGLELKRELMYGELSSLKKALLPLIAAIGGMIIPALLYLIFNYGSDTQRGAGIPMATDIAFALGVLSLLGSRVPVSLKVFLTALAVMDDLGAILIIAFFYSDNLSWLNLLIALTIFSILLIFNKYKKNNLLIYITGGILMWYFMHHSGIHATITGVLLAFTIPFGSFENNSPLLRLEHWLSIPVKFLVLPVFAVANTAILIEGSLIDTLSQPNSMGIISGLVFGKTLGIYLFSLIAVSVGFSKLPSGLSFRHIFGAGILGGIGFTMSIFIALLAFENPDHIVTSKIAILIASSVSGILGYLWLSSVKRK